MHFDFANICPESKSLKKFLNIIWRLLVIALVAFLLVKTIRSTGADVIGDLRNANHLLLALGFAFYGLIMLLNAVRWQMLLKAQNLLLSLMTAFRLSMTGFFFNCVLPGAISGDIVKIAMASRNYPDRKTEITLTILLDRIIGMFGLFFAATLATLISPQLLQQLHETAPGLFLVVMLVNLGTAGSLGLMLVFLLKPLLLSWKPVTALLSVLSRITPAFLRRLISRLDAALEMYRQQKRVLFVHLLYSTIIHLLCAASIMSIGRAIGENAMTAMQYNLTIQIADASGILPITPAGLGLRDSVSATFLQCFKINPPAIAGSIPVIYSLVIFAWGLLGGLAFCTLPDHRKLTHNLQDCQEQ